MASSLNANIRRHDMSAAESPSTLVAWWGAGLSTLLAIVKLFELWRDRFRIDVSHNFTGDEIIGNEILIRNLSSRSLILTHWELLYCSGRWPRRHLESFASAEYDSGDRRLEPHATHTLHFAGENYFSWEHNQLNGRRIFIRIHVAGRRPTLRLIYAP